MSDEVGGAGGTYSYDALKRLDNIWSSICSTQTGNFFSQLHIMLQNLGVNTP